MTKTTEPQRVAIDITPAQMLLVCFMTAAGAQLDRKQLAKDMRKMAAILVESAPVLAEGAATIDSLCNLIENVSGVLGGDLDKLGAGLGSSGVH